MAMNEESLKIACPLCGGQSGVMLTADRDENGIRREVRFCPRCAVGFTFPPPSPAELTALYSVEGYRAPSGAKFSTVFEALVRLFRLRRKRRIKRYIRKGRILDIGCGRGLFLSIMRKDGWDVAGTEFDEETASYASRSFGIPVRHGDPPAWGLTDESFDVITINHVLEHIRNPAETLRACGRLLRTGGLLVAAVPNIFSLQAAAGNDAWFHLDMPYHLYHFSEDGLVRLLRENSFRISRIRRFDLEHGPFGWLQTLLNRSGIRKNFLYDLLKTPELRRGRMLAGRKANVMFTLFLLPLYAPLSFALSLFESAILKRGATVEVYAVKE